MKKLFTLAAMLLAMAMFTSCDDTQNYYTHGFVGMTGTSSEVVQADMAIIQNAMNLEFGEQANFIVEGKTDKADKDLTKHFNKVVETINLNNTISGTMALTYSIRRGTLTVVEYTWEAKATE